MTSCSFCGQETEAHLLSISAKMPLARICDKCLFRETEKLFSVDANLPGALDRLDKEHRVIWARVTGALEARVQLLNTHAVALDSELGGLRDMKRKLQDALQQKPDLRTSAVKRLVDERMNPGSGRAPEAGAPMAAAAAK
jgi:hypothetical protein